MEKLLYSQNIRSLGATFDELNVELEVLNIKSLFLIVIKTWLREYQTLNIFCQGSGNLLKHAIENLKEVAMWQSLVLNKIISLPSKTS